MRTLRSHVMLLVMVVLGGLGCLLPLSVAAEDIVSLQYIGHQCIVLTAPDGTRIVTDPYQSAPKELGKFPENIEANAVTISHFHPDHNNFRAIKGNPQVINAPGTYQVGMVKITGYKGDHGNPNDRTNPVTVFVFEIGAIKIVHMGAQGLITQAEIQAAVQNAHVVLLAGYGDAQHPIDQQVAQMQQFKAQTLILTHYSFSAANRYFGAATLGELISRLSPAISVDKLGSELQITAAMPKQVVALAPSVLQPSASTKTYGQKLIETQDVGKVDAISGATWSNKKFKKIMEMALEQAIR